MPNTESAKKRVRSTARRTLINKMNKSAMLTHEKKFKKMLDDQTSNNEQIKESLSKCISSIDKNCKKGIIKKQTASRKKSKLSLKANQFFKQTDKQTNK